MTLFARKNVVVNEVMDRRCRDGDRCGVWIQSLVIKWEIRVNPKEP